MRSVGAGQRWIIQGKSILAFEMAQSGATFKHKTVSETLQQHFKDKKITVKGTALDLVTELLRIFTKEALSRAALQAKAEGDRHVATEHLEKILLQLLLDM